MAAKKTTKQKKARPVLGSFRQYLCTIGIGLVTSLGIALLQGLSLEHSAYMNARFISDGCFVTGMVLLGAGALSWIGGSGFFDIFGYGFRSLPMLFSPIRSPKQFPTFYDYKQTKAQRRGGPLFFLLISGAVFLLAATVCLSMYYNLPAA